MATYIGLISYTEKGIQAAKDIPDRLDKARTMFRAQGAELKSFHLTLGRYDAVAVVEAPDDATVARVLIATAGLGNIRTETLRAFDESELRDILSNLP